MQDFALPAGLVVVSAATACCRSLRNWGSETPRAAQLLCKKRRLVDEDLDMDLISSCPVQAAQWANVATIRILRRSCQGEFGLSINCPMAFAKSWPRRSNWTIFPSRLTR